MRWKPKNTILRRSDLSEGIHKLQHGGVAVRVPPTDLGAIFCPPAAEQCIERQLEPQRITADGTLEGIRVANMSSTLY